MRKATLVTKQSALPHISDWKQINWNKINRYVEKLQQRIYRAEKQGEARKVRNLQRLLLKSRAALLLSIRRVTQINKGRKTAGVDKKVIKTDAERIELSETMSKHSLYLHNPKPSHRTYIQKKNGKFRPLSIPTIRDRIYQNIVKMSLEPQWECRFEPTSYGFRPKRGCHDAIERIFLSLEGKRKQWIFEGDFKGCFDNLNQEHILREIKGFPGKKIIEKWMQAGYIDNGVFHETEKGSGQGSIISPLLANIALHGMEDELGVRYTPKYSPKRGLSYWNSGTCSVIRYADDFVCLCESREEATAVYQRLEPYLKKRGLELEPSKTRVVNIMEGFDFLGFNVRRYDDGKTNKLFIKPSKDSIKKAKKKLTDITKDCQGNNVEILIRRLNPVITGIGNYWKPMVSKKAFSKVDNHVFCITFRFLKKLHPKKPMKWLKKKYYPHFVTKQPNRWTLVSPGENTELKRMSTIPIRRYVVVRHNSSPYDATLKEYYKKREKINSRFPFYYTPNFLG